MFLEKNLFITISRKTSFARRTHKWLRRTVRQNALKHGKNEKIKFDNKSNYSQFFSV